MDFEFALWQMLHLFYKPQSVYRNFQYRKVRICFMEHGVIRDLQETKAQFARDDPAFLVLLAALLLVSTAGFSFVLGIHFWAFIKFLLYVIFVDLIGVECPNNVTLETREYSGWFSDCDWSLVRLQQASQAQSP